MSATRGASRTRRTALLAVGASVAALAAAAPAAAPATAAPARPAAAVTPVTGAATETLPSVDLATLDMVPTVMGGVATPDPARTSTSTINSYVWAVRQAGTRIFVGGMFLDVKADATAATVRQPFLAAFDAATGAWDPACRPALDNAVYTLAVLPDGSLLVGGEFTTVNGATRTGLVALDPGTCEVTAFPAQVQRPYSTNRAVVRDVEVVDGMLYAVGNFSRVLGPNGSYTGVYKAARVNATTGAVDRTWKPEITGSGAWGLAVDPLRNRVHLAGWFSGVNGTAGSGNYAVVDGTTGASVAGLTARPRNSTNRPEVYDTDLGVGTVFVGGSEHVLQTLDLDTGRQVAFSHTGYRGCGTENFLVCGFGAGGDYQVVQRLGDVVLAGCHCTKDKTGTQNWHWSSLSRSYTAHKHLMAYDARTGALQAAFKPDVDGAVDGAWAVGSDTNGCLYLGGDYTKGGTAAGRSRFVSGIAKFCPKKTAVTGDTKKPTAPTKLEGVDVGDGVVQLAWNAATDNVGVTRYRVTRTGAGTTDATGLLFTTGAGLTAATYTFTVAAVDAAGNVGPTATVDVTTGRAGTDTASPTAPTGVAATATATGVSLAWAPATDATGVTTYLVYRNGTYVGWSSSPAYTDTTAPTGAALTYQVRASDAAGNRSVRSEPVTVTRP